LGLEHDREGLFESKKSLCINSSAALLSEKDDEDEAYHAVEKDNDDDEEDPDDDDVVFKIQDWQKLSDQERIQKVQAFLKKLAFAHNNFKDGPKPFLKNLTVGPNPYGVDVAKSHNAILSEICSEIPSNATNVSNVAFKSESCSSVSLDHFSANRPTVAGIKLLSKI
jgi:hypothetical protein